jgi:hypothetical protein
LQYVPYAFYSYGVDATGVTGVLPVKAGGTGVTSLSDFKSKLNLDNQIVQFGSNVGDTLYMKPDINVYKTADGAWNRFIYLPVPTSSNNFLANRLNSTILISSGSTFSFTIKKENTNLNNDIIINTNEFATFIYNGSKWLFLEGKNAFTYNATDSLNNTYIGLNSLKSNSNGRQNIALGSEALRDNTIGNKNVAIGFSAMSLNSTYTNSTAIGYNAQVTASNQVQLGDVNITDVKTSGVISTSGIRVGTISPTISAIVEINSTTKGFLPPRMTASQRDNIISAVAGLVVWCTDCADYGELQVFNGNIWTNLIGSPASSPQAPSIQAAEASINFSINEDPGTGNILAVNDASFPMNVNVSSTIPSSGVNLDIIIRKDSDNTIIFSNSIISSTSLNSITVTGLISGVLYTATISVTSRSNISNTRTKSFKLARR